MFILIVQHYEDVYLRNELDWFDLFYESEKKYTPGGYGDDRWSLIQREAMRWKAETQERISDILGLKHNFLTKIHEHGVKGPGYPMMSKSYADLITEFYETVAPESPPIDRNLGLNASTRTTAREHTKAGRKFGIAS